MHLFQVGVGSGGMAVLDLLIRDERITKISIVEPDTYDQGNIHRHYFGNEHIGHNKADLAHQWIQRFRHDIEVDTYTVDLTDPKHQETINDIAASCNIGVCAADNELAKHHFDQLMRKHHKPWTLGEVLSGGIAGWVHRLLPDGACYGCVASHLQRSAPQEPAGPAPDYSQPNADMEQARIPASKTAISTIASLHANVTLDMLEPEPMHNFTCLMIPLKKVPGLFDEPFRVHRFMIPQSLSCTICSTERLFVGEDLDVALDDALSRLADG